MTTGYIIWIIGYQFYCGLILKTKRQSNKLTSKDVILLFALGLILWPLVLGFVATDYLDKETK